MYKVHTKVRVAIDVFYCEYNHDARTQSPRLSAARLQLAVDRRGLGPRDQVEQSTQRASFVATYLPRVYTAAAAAEAAVGHRAGVGCLVAKKSPGEAPRHVSVRPN